MVSAVNFCIAYVIVDVLCLVLTIIVATNVSRDSGSETQVRYFYLLLSANFVFVICDALWAILVFSQLFEPSDLLLCIVNGINLTAIAFAAYFWFGFSLAHFDSQVTNSRTLRLVCSLPALAVVIIHTVGYFTDQNVIFMPDGSIRYGMAHTIISLVPLVYLLAATLVALHRFRTATSRSARRTSLVFILFMLAPAAAAIFDIFVPDMPVAAAGIMVSVVFVIMAMQEARISNDALTGLNNRRRADAYLDEAISRASEERPLYLFIMDMDHFKTINDTYGHLEGDHALRLMADALRSVCSRVNAFAARWGGDEFVLIGAGVPFSETEVVAQVIRQELQKEATAARVAYRLECSVGSVRCASPDCDRDQLVAEADTELYRNKQARR